MTGLAKQLQQQVASQHPLSDSGVPVKLCLAFSGGLDSTVLLHVLKHLSTYRSNLALRAVHVDHGLHPDSSAWAEHCRQHCEALEIGCDVVTVDVGNAGGPEAAARAARYQALADVLYPGEVLVLAQHQDDQAETYLLQLLRGGGVHGLAAMPSATDFAGGRLWRPLMGVSRDELAQYAEAYGLQWVDDPSNTDIRYDRNFVRHRVMPELQQRWPEAAAMIARSARYAAESAQLVDALAASDADGVVTGRCLNIDRLQALEPLRQRNVLRFVIRSCGLPVPPETRVQEILGPCLNAADDAVPQVVWSGGFVARYRGYLVVQPEAALQPPKAGVVPLEQLDSGASAADLVQDLVPDLGGAAGVLRCEPTRGSGLAARWLAQPLEVRFRQGGERIKPIGRTHHRSLKNLFQESGVVPWVRPAVPLLYCNGQLLAVGDFWLAAEGQADAGEAGFRLRWETPSIKRIAEP